MGELLAFFGEIDYNFISVHKEGIDMKLGVFTVLFSKMEFTEMLDYVKESGLDAVEVGTGCYPGNAHCKPKELLEDDRKLKQFEKRGRRSWFDY